MTTKEIQNIAIKYLKYRSNSIVFSEFELNTNPEQPIRFDIIRIRLERHYIEGYEIKSSPADFTRDEKWHLYLPYVNKFYFIVPVEMVKSIKINGFGIGIMTIDNNRIHLIKRAKLLNSPWKITPFGRIPYQRMLELALEKFKNMYWNHHQEY